MKYIMLTTQRVEKTLANELPNKFGLVIDGWNQGTTRYIAMFASYSNSDGRSVLPLLAIFPLDETECTLENHKEFINDVLEKYGKSVASIVFLVAEYSAVNTGLAQLLSVPMISCAIHRFNLACNAFLEPYESVLAKISSLMALLSYGVEARKLRAITDIEPYNRDVTRWETTFEMIKRFFRLLEFIEKTDQVKSSFMPTPAELLPLQDIIKDLEEFESTSKVLQDPKRTLAEVRAIFDEMLVHYPMMKDYLSASGEIVHSPEFESAVVKILDRECDKLTDPERLLVEPFTVMRDIPDTSIAFQALLKKRKRTHKDYFDLCYIPPTSNIMKRFYGEERIVVTDKSDFGKTLTRYTFDCITSEFPTFLNINCAFWDFALVKEIVRAK